MMRRVAITGLEEPEPWRDVVRSLLVEAVPPDQIVWASDATPGLFEEDRPFVPAGESLALPKSFVRLAESVLMHRDVGKFDLLYRIAWRVRARTLRMSDAADKDLQRANHLAKSVGRDIHKMRAFVRFRLVADGHYVSWFEPDHLIVRANAGFFVRRFAAMRWSILTPDLCIHWDGESVRESAGLDDRPALTDDAVEALWTRYYASTFNPARLKIGAMIKEMPRRYWKNLPEAALIPSLIADAQAREDAMFE